MAEKFEFRSVFNPQSVHYTAHQISKAYPLFQEEKFLQSVLENFETLGYKERIERISQKLHDYLPSDISRSIEILIDALGPEIEGDTLEGYEGFYVLPFCDYVAKYGHNHFKVSMQAQIEMTKRFSAEYSIRSFLQREPKKTLTFLQTLSKSPNPHVRRLISEGTRPRLPLGIQLKAFIHNPEPVLKLLESLKDEPTRLVQRSIANSLNDIAKDNPDKVIQFLQKWKVQKVRDYEWIAKHATRTLIKQGDSTALELLGFNTHAQVTLEDFHLQNDKITLGEDLEFTFKLISHEKNDEKLVIDYILYFKKANGSHKAKIFKVKTTTLKALDTLHIEKKHPIKFATTRRYYSGVQQIAIQVNGKILSQTLEFNLTV